MKSTHIYMSTHTKKCMDEHIVMGGTTFNEPILHRCSESGAWQWSCEVVVLIVVVIQENYLFHAKERNAVGEKASKIGNTARACRTFGFHVEVPCLVEGEWSTFFHII